MAIKDNRASFSLPAGIVLRLEAAAIAEHTSMAALLRAAIDRYLAENPQTEQRERKVIVSIQRWTTRREPVHAAAVARGISTSALVALACEAFLDAESARDPACDGIDRETTPAASESAPGAR